MRCAIYSRFSSEMQSPRSVEDQERECRAFARRQDWEVIASYEDAAVRAGASAGRKGYQAMVEAARQGTFDILLVEEVSRFSRDFLGGLAELAKLEEYGVQLADTKQGRLDLQSPAGQISVAFGLVSSQAETQRLGERSKRGLKGKTINGFSSGGQPPFGYRRVPVFSETEKDVDGRPVRIGVRFEPEPAEAVVVQRVFRLYRDGATKHYITRTLNDEGVLTRRAAGTRMGRQNSGTWSPASIKTMLENRLYIGDRVWNRFSRTGKKLPTTGKKQERPNPEEDWITVKNFAPAIIDEDVWNAVQERLAIDGEKYRKQHGANQGRQYLLSGFVRCALCGANFVIGVHRGSPPVPHYRCSFHARGKSVCANRSNVPVPALERKIRDTLDALIKAPHRLEELVADHNKRVEHANEAQLSTVHALEQRRATHEDQRDRLVEAIKLGAGAAKVLVDELAKVESEIEQMTDKIRKAESLLQPLLVPKKVIPADYASGAMSLFTDDFVQNRRLLEETVDSIVVYSDESLLLQFRDTNLFEPVHYVRMTRVDGTPEEASIQEDRKRNRKAFQQTYSALDALKNVDRDNLEIDVHDSDEGPAYVIMSRGAVHRSFGPSGEQTTGEITLASPGGFEPPYQG